MNVITNRISIDLMKPAEPAVIHAVQGECNTRQVQLSLFCDGNPWEIPADTFLAVRYGRVMQTGGYYDTLPDGSKACHYEGNTIVVILAPQMMSEAGMVLAQVEMMQENQVLTTFSFKIVVELNPAVGILQPENYINWQQWIEQELDKYIEKVNSSGQLLGGTMAGPIHMNGNGINGLPAPTSEDQAANMGFVNQQVKKAAPRNLLDNSDFTNLVAQAGVGGKHGTTIYAADRWILSNGTVSYEYGTGLLLNGTIVQKLEKAPANAQAFVGMTSGSASISYNVSAKEVMIISDGGILNWASLCEGEYTAETLPEYRPKGYGAELAECLRYFERLGGHGSEVLGNTVYVVGGFSSFVSSISYYPKRIPRPTVQLYDPSNYRLLFKTADTAQVFGASTVESFGDITAQSPFATITVNLSNAEGSTCWVMLQRADNAPNAYIDICADL